MSMTYKNAGVDISEGNAFVERIKKINHGLPGGFAAKIPAPKGACEFVMHSNALPQKHRYESKALFYLGAMTAQQAINKARARNTTPRFALDTIILSDLFAKRDIAIVRGMLCAFGKARCTLCGGETAEHAGKQGISLVVLLLCETQR